MTSTFVVLCPEGVVIAADSRITYQLHPQNHWKIGHIDNVQKIFHLKEPNVCGSYWGLAEIQGKPILQHLQDFEKSQLSRSDDVDSIAKKMKTYLENIAPKIERRMGLHITGYIDNTPKLRHVFHEFWHINGEFVNEDCHAECYLPPLGNKVMYREPKEYPVLFNGDNLVANALFNYAPKFPPYSAIVPHKLSLGDCVELAKLIIGMSIHRLNYFFDQRMQQNKVPKTVGGPIYIATITPEKGFNLSQYDPNKL